MKEMKENDKVLIHWNKEEFEKLLYMSSEGTLEELQVSIEQENNAQLSIFANDLYNRKGKMDSMLELEYDEHNNPLIISVTFVIPGESHTWMITGAAENNFSLQTFNDKFVEKAILNKKTVSAQT
ncbi:hypothetical protein J9317_17990 [Metabacillus sp. KIGAM252]|uniref:DUF1795 domain-containing protein n=1 Tax=Metabacillus flavus TaxID=2823519 RepID=A0ABS5LJJ0_9BACI|nr:hypothetical protein [Metabacillus flavus]MBS2970638.1 hypothetical protein [Metabacillus flavus]